jgi:hypothetical protein
MVNRRLCERISARAGAASHRTDDTGRHTELAPTIRLRRSEPIRLPGARTVPPHSRVAAGQLMHT